MSELLGEHAAIATNRAWHIASRWQEFEGEMRSALLRALLVVGFYSVQLVHFSTLTQAADSERVFHRQVTIAAASWLLLSLAIFVGLRGGFMPPTLKYIATTVDLGLVTLLAWLGHGPSSPLVTAYFLVLALAAIRFRIGLIWYSTIASQVCYMILVAANDSSWFSADHATPILTQAVTLCSLAATGIVLGQIVRAAQSISQSFHARVDVRADEVQQ
jgi:hypothetical protein